MASVNGFHSAAALLTLAALASYLNHRYIKLPPTIGMMVISLLGSLILVALGHIHVVDPWRIAQFVTALDFSDLLLHGMLGYLLFAGALHINLADLHEVKVLITVLATAGVFIATVVSGTLFWLLAHWLGFNIPLLYAMVFGALIAPTDPIAVMGVLKNVGAPKKLEMKIAGESLFNDGVAVVSFITLLGLATGVSALDGEHVILVLGEEVLGGILLGLVLGWVSYRLIRSANAYQVEIFLTLALVAGAYALSESIHVSAPITVVVAGLLIGNHGRSFAMTETTRERLDAFWELVDEFLNAILFVLIGLEIIALHLTASFISAGLLTIVAVLIGRFISVALPLQLLRLRRAVLPGTIRVLTWCGLRGGISIAMALSLPASKERELILAVTYIVVLFSVLVQGLSVARLVRYISLPRPNT